MFDRLLKNLRRALSPRARRTEAARRFRHLTMLGLEDRRLMAAQDFTVYESQNLLDPQTSTFMRPDIATTGDYIVSVYNSKTNAQISKNNGVDWENFNPDATPRPNTYPITDPLFWGNFTGVQQVASDTRRGMILRTMEYAPGGVADDPTTFVNGVRLAVARTPAELNNQQWRYYEFSSMGLGLERGQVLEGIRMEMSDNFAYFVGYASQLELTDVPGVFDREFVGTVWWRVGLEALYYTGEIEMNIAHVELGHRLSITSGAKDTIYGAVLTPGETISTMRVFSWNDNDLGPREYDVKGIPTVGFVDQDDTGTAYISTGWVGRGRVGFMWDAPRRPNVGRPFDFVRSVVFNEQNLTERMLDPFSTVNPIDSQPDIYSTSESYRNPVAQSTPKGDIAVTVTKTGATAATTGALKTVVLIDDKYSRGDDLLATPITFEEQPLAPSGAAGLLGDVTYMGLTFDDVYTNTWMTNTYKYVGGAQRRANNHFYWFGREDNTVRPGKNMRGNTFDIVQDGAAPGDAIDVEYTIANTGLLGTGTFNVAFYASADAKIDATDLKLTTVPVSTIGRASVSSLLTQSLTLPAAANPIWQSVVAGQLHIGIIIDPAKVSAEGTETDNSNLGLGIDSGTVLGAAFGGSNDTLATAVNLGIISGRRNYKQLGILPATDIDFYEFVAPHSGNVTLSLAFAHAQGDLLLRAFNNSGTQIAISDSSTNATGTESVTFAVTKGQSYLFEVAGATLIDRNAYSLTTDYRLPDDTTEDPDGPGTANPLTRNDTFATASNLGKFDFYNSNGATISKFDDRDFYKFKANRNGPLTVSLAFTRANGDLKLKLYDEYGNVLGTRFNGTNWEMLKTSVIADHVYYIQVDGNGLDTNYYNMSITGVLPPVTYSGNLAIVTGTATADTIEFSPLTSAGQHTVRVNGVNFPVPDTVTIFNVSGKALTDTFIFHGFTLDDTINVTPTVVTASNSGYNTTFNLDTIELVTAEGGDGNDVLSASGTLPVSLFGNSGDDILTGGAGHDTLSGGDGVDFLDGGNGNDRYFGGSGPDVLSDSTGSDFLAAGAGADLYLFDDAFGTQQDTLEEFAGNGTDDLDFSFSTVGVTINLSSTTRNIGTHGSRTLFVNVLGQAANFENLFGGLGNDNLTGNALANTLDGGEGNDVLLGAAGNDRYVFNNPIAAQTDRVGEVTNAGTDLLDFRNSSVKVVADLTSNAALATQGIRKIQVATGTTFSALNIEAVFGGSGDDTLRGNAAANFIDGGAGNDLLAGRAGNDVYNLVDHATAETDTISELPGGGSDTLTFQNATQALKLDLRESIDIGSYGLAVLKTVAGESANLEHVIGTGDDDLIIGNDNANNLFGDLGDDVLIGGKGLDQLSGGEGEDLLIGGFVLNSLDMSLIYDEWVSAKLYGARVRNIRGPVGGANGTNFLTSLTVSDDSQRDTISGGNDLDWFWLGASDVSDRIPVTESLN
jgi:Ca2+-binding RTX toxin-like protein